MNSQVRFAAPWGRVLKVVSTGVSAMLIVMIFCGAFVMHGAPPISRWSMVLLPLALLLGTPPFMVSGYTLDRGQLFIERLGWRTRFGLRGLREAVVSRDLVRGSIRVFGNGGMFSITGLFWNRRLGRHRAFINDLNRVVVLRGADRTIVVSPGDPEQFVQEILAQADHVQASHAT